MAKVIRVQLFGVNATNGVGTVSTWHYTYADFAFSPQQYITDLLTAFQLVNNMAFHYTTCITAEWALTRIRGTHVKTTTIPPYFIQQTLTNPGTLAAPTAPPQVAVVVRRTADIAARWNYGRVFVPCVPTAGLNNGRVAIPSLLQSSLDNLALEMPIAYTGAITGTVFLPCLIRRGQFDSDGGPTVTIVKAGAWDVITRVQHRREIGVGV